MKILIADDHQMIRDGVRRVLEQQAGWSVVAEATDGEEALRLIEELRPDVAILDLAMPRRNGLAVASELRKCSSETGVLIFTMHHSDQVTREILAAGARGYVLKSDPANELVAAVDAVGSGKMAFPAHAQRVLVDVCANRRMRSPVQELSPREREILEKLAAGRTMKEIAFDLGISAKTVETHRQHLMQKLQIDSLPGLVHYAVRNGMVDPWEVVQQ